MELATFRQRVRNTFGDDLHRASPASIREFLDTLNAEGIDPTPGGRIVVEESAQTYEEVMRTFLLRMLEMPSDRAVVHLWKACAEFTYAVVAANEADENHRLARPTPLPGAHR